MGKDIGYYPKGPINQHKALATGGKLPECDTRNLGGGFEEKGSHGSVRKSGTSTGSRGKRST